MTCRKIFLSWCLVFLVAIACVYFLSLGLSVDRPISDHFFTRPCLMKNEQACWLINKEDRPLKYYLHDYPDRVFAFIGVISAIGFILGFFSQKFRRYRLISGGLAASLAMGPGIVALLKGFSGHYCPNQLAEYNGPIGDLLDSYKPSPRCFPASHPAAGFAFIVFSFLPVRRLWRIFGAVTGGTMGLILAGIQLVKGEHFLSHVLATFVIAVFVCYSIRSAVDLWLLSRAPQKVQDSK